MAKSRSWFVIGLNAMFKLLMSLERSPVGGC